MHIHLNTLNLLKNNFFFEIFVEDFVIAFSLRYYWKDLLAWHIYCLIQYLKLFTSWVRWFSLLGTWVTPNTTSLSENHLTFFNPFYNIWIIWWSITLIQLSTLHVDSSINWILIKPFLEIKRYIFKVYNFRDLTAVAGQRRKLIGIWHTWNGYWCTEGTKS